MRRVWLFVGLWVTSIAAFPIHVALAFGLWVVLLAPGLIEIHRQFQNEPDPYCSRSSQENSVALTKNPSVIG